MLCRLNFANYFYIMRTKAKRKEESSELMYPINKVNKMIGRIQQMKFLYIQNNVWLSLTKCLEYPR